MQWGLTRATGIKLPFRNLRYRPGRPVGIAILVVSLAASETEFLLIRRDLIVAAIVVAALAVVAEMACLHAALSGYPPGSATRCCRNSPACSRTPGT